jgi:V/A-type H+-transporting ATPase subunit I
MFKPTPMKKLNMLVLERHVHGLLEELGKLGLLELTRTDSEGLPLDFTQGGEPLERIVRLEGMNEKLLREFRITPESGEPQEHRIGLDEIEKDLTEAEVEWDALRGAMRASEERLKTLHDGIRELEGVEPIDVPVDRLKGFSFLHFTVGSLPEEKVRVLEEKLRPGEMLLPYKTAAGRDRVVGITSRKGRFALDTTLEQAGFEKSPLPEIGEEKPSRILQAMRDKLRAERERRYGLEARESEFRARWAPVLLSYRQRILIEKGIAEARAHFGRTDFTAVLSGWVPEKELDRVRETVLRLTDYTALMEVLGPEEIEARGGSPRVPVLLDLPWYLKPFAGLTAGYGLPRYGELEPTVMVALSFLLIFGIMFGDMGHGLVLVLAGLLLYRSRRPRIGRIRSLGIVVVAAGLSSMLFGLLFGSIFCLSGEVTGLHPLWLEPMRDMRILFFVSLGIGMVLVSLGMILNVINRIRAKDFRRGFLDKFGLMGVIFYWGAIGLLLKRYVFQTGGITGLEVLLLAIPLLFIFLGEPLYNLLARKPKVLEHGLLTYIMESLVGLLEIFASLLANTVSFVRIGAFALAHAGLSFAVFYLTRMLMKEGALFGSIAGAVVFLLGNMLVILLEGLVCSIQSIRLEYYEFFSKFFSGDGKAFKPFVFMKS